MHGPDRKEMEEQTRNDWGRIVSPKDNDIDELAEMLSDLTSRNIESFVFVNNHFEGSAPRTIVRIEERLELRSKPNGSLDRITSG